MLTILIISEVLSRHSFVVFVVVLVFFSGVCGGRRGGGGEGGGDQFFNSFCRSRSHGLNLACMLLKIRIASGFLFLELTYKQDKCC